MKNLPQCALLCWYKKGIIHSTKRQNLHPHVKSRSCWELQTWPNFNLQLWCKPCMFPLFLALPFLWLSCFKSQMTLDIPNWRKLSCKTHLKIAYSFKHDHVCKINKDVSRPLLFKPKKPPLSKNSGFIFTEWVICPSNCLQILSGTRRRGKRQQNNVVLPERENTLN